MNLHCGGREGRADHDELDHRVDLADRRRVHLGRRDGHVKVLAQGELKREECKQRKALSLVGRVTDRGRHAHVSDVEAGVDEEDVPGDD